MQPYQPNPYAYAPAPAPPARSSGRGWLLLGVAGMALGLLGSIAFVALGGWLLGEDVTRLLRAHPTATTTLGDVDECSLDWGDSIADTRDEYMHYRCTAAKTNARAILHTESTGPEGEEQLVDGTLVLPSGEQIALRP